MIISPNVPRNYDELVQAYQDKNKINIQEIIRGIIPSSLVCQNERLKSINVVLKSILAINILEYEQLLKRDDVDERIMFLFKVLIYDYFDYCQAFNAFCGIQIYSVARSLCDQSRIILLCLCDSDFMEYYYSEYNDDEKKERYYRKRESNISKRLREIAEQAKELNDNKNFYVESSIFNLTTELYSSLTDKLGQLSHLSEITLAKQLIPSSMKLEFETINGDECLKFNDNIIEYLVYTTLSIILIFNAEGVEINDKSYQLYTFLNWLGDELVKFRNVDKCLTELTRQARELCLSEEASNDL